MNKTIKNQAFEKSEYGKLAHKSFSFSEINSKIDSNVL